MPRAPLTLLLPFVLAAGLAGAFSFSLTGPLRAAHAAAACPYAIETLTALPPNQLAALRAGRPIASAGAGHAPHACYATPAALGRAASAGALALDGSATMRQVQSGLTALAAHPALVYAAAAGAGRGATSGGHPLALPASARLTHVARVIHPARTPVLYAQILACAYSAPNAGGYTVCFSDGGSGLCVHTSQTYFEDYWSAFQIASIWFAPGDDCLSVYTWDDWHGSGTVARLDNTDWNTHINNVHCTYAESPGTCGWTENVWINSLLFTALHQYGIDYVAR